MSTEKKHALAIFQAAIEAVQPIQLLLSYISIDKETLTICQQSISLAAIRHIYVIGAGKAAAAMAVETEKIIGPLIRDGIVVTKYGHSLPSQRIKIIEGAHPVPDNNCVEAVNQTISLLKNAGPSDLVICLLSGGASALWCDLLPGISIGDTQTVFDLLIKSGAGIQEINTVRKHLSRIKGGQLIRHCGGAKLFSLIISDVPGDDLSVIASGPTTADPSSFADVFHILKDHQLLEKLPAAVRIHLEKGLNGAIAETPKPGDELFRFTHNMIIGSNSIALNAAVEKAKALGYIVHLRNGIVTGDTVIEAKAFISQLLEYKGKKPVCFLQGGETTVKVTGNGKGGRNQHFVLSALKEITDKFITTAEKNFIILSGGTDGTDGPTDAAGAIGDQNTLTILANKNLSIKQYLDNHDAYHLFEQTNGLLKTGPTQTNVMDIMLGILN